MLLREGENAVDGTIDVGQDVLGRNAIGRELSRGEPAVAQGVSRRPINTLMRFSIDLDDEPRLVTVEVGDIGSRRCDLWNLNLRDRALNSGHSSTSGSGICVRSALANSLVSPDTCST